MTDHPALPSSVHSFPPAVSSTRRACLQLGPDGSLYIVEQGSNDVLRYNNSGLSTFVTPGSGGLDLPFKAVFGPDGNLYVTSWGTDQMRFAITAKPEHLLTRLLQPARRPQFPGLVGIRQRTATYMQARIPHPQGLTRASCVSTRPQVLSWTPSYWGETAGPSASAREISSTTRPTAQEALLISSARPQWRHSPSA